MRTSDRAEFAKIFIGLSELYSREYTKVAVGLFWESLKDYDFESVRAAFSAHVRSPDCGQYPPKPADIIKRIEGTSRDSSFLAWSKVEKAVERVGCYQTVVFDDPIIHAVIENMGGWISLGEKTGEEWPFVKNDFLSQYRGHKERGGKIDCHGKLIGMSEAENRRSGFPAPPPVLIGDAEKAKMVLVGASNKPAIEFKEHEPT